MHYRSTVKRTVSRFALPECITNETLTNFVGTPGSLQSIWGFSFRDVSGVDFSGVDDETLFQIAFNEETLWGKTRYPHAGVFEQMKNPGLGIRALHANGITGEGINIAVVDKPILKNHSEFSGRLSAYTEITKHERNADYHFHGMTCASFACGKTTGTAPGAKLFYFAYPDYFTDDNMYWQYYFTAFDMIIEHNKTSKDKINIVSVSAGVPKTKVKLFDDLLHYEKRMRENGLYLIDSNHFGQTFTCASRVYGISVENADGYKLDNWQVNPWDKNRILIPSGGRTGACNSGIDQFIYGGNQSCYSWAIPYLCGVFALSMQCNASVTYSDFCALAQQTAYVNRQGLKMINPRGIMEKL